MPVCQRLFSLLAAFALATTASAADPKWTKLQAPSFSVISQVSDDDTRRWALEFDQFVGAMHTLYDVKEGALPPLTIVLFRQSRDFAPYRATTQSGQTQSDGLFGRTGDWSVIGLSGGSRDAMTRRVIYHEAVHWFASASDTPLPLWFSEGFAEVLSTFRNVNGKGRWGEAIENNVAYLSDFGLLPVETLLRASQDEALHGAGNDKYYPQAWAFVHYLMFGNGGAQVTKLSEFLRQQRQTDLDTAFTTAFGKSYDDFGIELRRYLSNGRYSYAEVELRNRSAEMAIGPATEIDVEAALARLAAIGNNQDLALAHADRLLALAPDAPLGYELKVYAVDEDDALVDIALERAIGLGSRDASIYTAKADRLIAANQSSGHLDEQLPADVARTAADLYQQAIGLRPRDTAAFRGLALALLNVTVSTTSDQLIVSAGRIVLPTNGLLLVGQAAIEMGGDNPLAATQLLREATLEPFTLPSGLRASVTALRMKWLGEWSTMELGSMYADGRFGDAQAFVAERLADESITGPLRTMLDNTQKDLPDFERLYAALQAGLGGRSQETIELLTALVNDPSTRDRPRRTAQRFLEQAGVGAVPAQE